MSILFITKPNKILKKTVTNPDMTKQKYSRAHKQKNPNIFICTF